MPYNTGLFTSQQIRAFKLIMLMRQKEARLDYKSLCKELNCSFLTLQSEIGNLSALPEVAAINYVTSHLNIHYHHQYGTQKSHQSLLKESLALKLMELLFFTDPPSLEDLADQLFVSLSTLKRLLARTNRYLHNHYHFKIDQKRLIFCGDEEKIRLFFLRYFSEAYDTFDWPLSHQMPKQQIHLLLSAFYKNKDISNFWDQQHLHLLIGINLYRYMHGHSCRTTQTDKYYLTKSFPTFSKYLHQLYQNLPELNGILVDETAYIDIFQQLLHPCIKLQTINQTKTATKRIEDWVLFLDKLQEKIAVPMSNSFQIATKLANAFYLGVWDSHRNFLIYDYRKDYLHYFKKEYHEFYKWIQTELLSFYQRQDFEYDSELLTTQTYIILIYWNNLFIHLSNLLTKQKLLIIERGSHNLGQFLQGYLGQFFDITLFKDLDLNLETIENTYDLILTDTILPANLKTEIFYFNQLIPSLVLEKINHYLRQKLQCQFIKK